MMSHRLATICPGRAVKCETKSAMSIYSIFVIFLLTADELLFLRNLFMSITSPVLLSGLQTAAQTSSQKELGAVSIRYVPFLLKE